MADRHRCRRNRCRRRDSCRCDSRRCRCGCGRCRFGARRIGRRNSCVRRRRRRRRRRHAAWRVCHVVGLARTGQATRLGAQRRIERDADGAVGRRQMTTVTIVAKVDRARIGVVALRVGRTVAWHTARQRVVDDRSAVTTKALALGARIVIEERAFCVDRRRQPTTVTVDALVDLALIPFVVIRTAFAIVINHALGCRRRNCRRWWWRSCRRRGRCNGCRRRCGWRRGCRRRRADAVSLGATHAMTVCGRATRRRRDGAVLATCVATHLVRAHVVVVAHGAVVALLAVAVVAHVATEIVATVRRAVRRRRRARRDVGADRDVNVAFVPATIGRTVGQRRRRLLLKQRKALRIVRATMLLGQRCRVRRRRLARRCGARRGRRCRRRCACRRRVSACRCLCRRRCSACRCERSFRCRRSCARRCERRLCR